MKRYLSKLNLSKLIEITLNIALAGFLSALFPSIWQPRTPEEMSLYGFLATLGIVLLVFHDLLNWLSRIGKTAAKIRAGVLTLVDIPRWVSIQALRLIMVFSVGGAIYSLVVPMQTIESDILPIWFSVQSFFVGALTLWGIYFSWRLVDAWGNFFAQNAPDEEEEQGGVDHAPNTA